MMIQVPLYVYVLSLAIVAIFTYQIVDTIYLNKYIDFRSKMFQINNQSILDTIKFLSQERDDNE